MLDGPFAFTVQAEGAEDLGLLAVIYARHGHRVHTEDTVLLRAPAAAVEGESDAVERRMGAAEILRSRIRIPEQVEAQRERVVGIRVRGPVVDQPLQIG